METKKGIPVFGGIAIGEAFVLTSKAYRILKRFIPQEPAAIQTEKDRYRHAIQSAIDELAAIEQSTAHSKDISVIFQGHRLIIEDASIEHEVMDRIENSFYTAEYAVYNVMWWHRRKLKVLKNEYASRMLSDLEDIEHRLLRHLLGGQPEDIPSQQKPVILIARDLTPSQTALLPLDTVLGFAIDRGGRTSHTAIVARTRGIPAVVALGNCSTDVCSGDTVIVDGFEGSLIIQPDTATLSHYSEIQHQQTVRKTKIFRLRHLPTETVDGFSITLRANIEDHTEVKIAIDNGAAGIGLYRTEFIYVSHPDPREEVQFEIYRQAISDLQGHKLVIRTFDLGADKMGGEELNEQNPFLGCRSIRLCFEKMDVFRAQLRAILRASALGDIDVMFPMISSLEEVLQAKAILAEVKAELARENIPFNHNIKVGIMIEIPSAAIICDILAREVNFFSIGTNDLIQYTLAVDRINERVAHLYKPGHPAIFRLMQRVVEVARANHVKVCVCGEMSSEICYLIPMVGLGLREFSMSPAMIPEIKDVIRRFTRYHAAEVARRVLACQTHEAALEYLNEEVVALR
jgi:phosphotransferase system enzyme I (PtsI)